MYIIKKKSQTDIFLPWWLQKVFLRGFSKDRYIFSELESDFLFQERPDVNSWRRQSRPSVHVYVCDVNGRSVFDHCDFLLLLLLLLLLLDGVTHATRVILVVAAARGPAHDAENDDRDCNLFLHCV